MTTDPKHELRWTPPGECGLVVHRSEHWGYNSIAIVSGMEACAVDPGLTPNEIDAFRARVEEGGRRVTTVVLTHSHHDHVRGWMRFPGARIVAPEAVKAKEDGPRTRILAGKRKFDQRMGIEEADFAYPEVDDTFDDAMTIRVGRLDVALEFLPGHSNCTSVVTIPELGALLSADYLVAPGLPYCRWEPAPFEAANRRIGELVREHGLGLIVPAHNDLLESTAAALDAIETELSYFRFLRAEVEACVKEGLHQDVILRRCSRAMTERRGVDLGPRARQDADNARRILIEITC